MMKKFLVLLLISALAIFIFAGCDGLVPSEGEGEGEGEGEVEEVTVEIDGAVAINGKTYVSYGNHEITVTFPAPVANASAWMSECTGYYGEGDFDDKVILDNNIVLFPNEDKTVWTGSGYFGGYGIPVNGRQPLPFRSSPCCASYLYIDAGECDEDVCIAIPVIIDWEPPYACIEVEAAACDCEGCEITFSSTSEEQDCAEAEECCGDDCSGLAGWSIAVYDEDPFDKCCETPCSEPIWTASGTDCPIEATTGCLEPTEEGEYYYVITSLVDNVGLEAKYYATMTIAECEEDVDEDCDTGCEVEVIQYYADLLDCACTSWTSSISDTSCAIGTCDWEWNNCGF